MRASAPGQPASGEWAPRYDAHAEVLAQRNHLPLFFTVEQVVMVLHGDELRQPMQSGRVLGLGELPGVHRGGAEVSGLAGVDDISQRVECLFDRSGAVPAMDLIEVHVVGPEPLQGSVYRG